MLKITFEDLNKVQFTKRNIKISRFTVYSKIKQGRKFVYHSTAHSRSHEKGYHFSKTQSYGNGKKCMLEIIRRNNTVLFHYEYFKILLLYFKKYLGFKNLRLEKNEKIGCMLHCYKIEFNFLQKKFSKHLLRNIIAALLYCEIKCIKSSVARVV